MKAKQSKRSALAAMSRNTPTRNRWLAMLGSPVAVPHGERMAQLAAICAKFQRSQSNLPRALQVRRERQFKRTIAAKLVALLWDSLADLDATRFDQFAAIIRRVREHDEAAGNNWQALPLAEKLFRLADVARTKGKPRTSQEILRLAGVNKEHDDASRERKALALAGKWLAPGKRGPKKVTRKL